MILLIEDDPMLQTLVARLLNDDGYEVQVVSTLAETRAIIAAPAYLQTIELILLDLHLPDGHGLELLTEYRAGEQLGQQRPPIIVMTADVSLQSAVRSLRLGAFDYVLKPMNIEVFLAGVRRAIEYKQLRAEAQSLRLFQAHKTAMQATALSVAHHLTQHLTVIMGEAYLVIEDKPSAPIQESLERMLHAAEAAVQVINNLRNARQFITKISSRNESILDLAAATDLSPDEQT
jgi:DNA-binding response OmpR family regulator